MSMDWMLQSKDIECHTGIKKKKRKARANNMLPKRDPSQGKGHTQTVSEGMEKKIMTRKQESQYKISFKTKTIKKDKGGKYLMLKGSIQEEDVTLINIYAPNIRAFKYKKPTEKEDLMGIK